MAGKGIKNKTILLIICIILVLALLFLFNYFTKKSVEKFTNPYDIPVVVICWNNFYFVKNFVEQLKKYKNPIILLDNKSNFEPLLEYYKEIKEELQDKIEIRLLDQNYGSTVFLKLKHTLPDVYILSDPDLELNPNMPENFAEIFLAISEKYKYYKVGSAIDISDKENYFSCEGGSPGDTVHKWEAQYWEKKIEDTEFNNPIYDAPLDTTFCLVNVKYDNGYMYHGLRVAGDFTVKHLPWYKDFLVNNVSNEELDNWKQNNNSSSILKSCINV